MQSKDLDADDLRRLYHDKGKTLADIAEIYGCHKQTVANWMERHGIPRRGKAAHQKRSPPAHGWDSRNYEYVANTFKGEQKFVRVHQLIAIAKGASPYKVFGGGYDIHHKNGCQMDNRPSNLETIKHGKHRSAHEHGVGKPWSQEEYLREHYKEKGKSLSDIAGEHNVSSTTIHYWMEKHDIDRRPQPGSE